MELQDIGSLLRQERERQGLTVDDIIHRTKISRRNIEALEEGNEGKLPHPVYARGFVKSYAQSLGLDQDEIGSSFAAVYGLEEEEESSEDAESVIHEEFSRPKRGPLILTVFGALAVVFLMAAYLVLSSGGSERSAESSSLSASSPVQSEEVPSREHGESEPVDIPVVPEESRTIEPLSPSLEPESSTGANTTKDSAHGTDSSDSLDTIHPAPENSSVEREHTLTVNAADECWLQANVDGRPTEFLLQPEQQVDFVFEEDLILRLGNAGGVEISYNGSPYILSAGSGDVRTLLFPPKQQ